MVSVPSRPAETAVFTGLGSHNFSSHEKAHSSYPPAVTCVIKLKTDHKVVPIIRGAYPSWQRCLIDEEAESTRWTKLKLINHWEAENGFPKTEDHREKFVGAGF